MWFWLVMMFPADQGAAADEPDGLSTRSGGKRAAGARHAQLLRAVQEDLHRRPGAEIIKGTTTHWMTCRKVHVSGILHTFTVILLLLYFYFARFTVDIYLSTEVFMHFVVRYQCFSWSKGSQNQAYRLVYLHNYIIFQKRSTFYCTINTFSRYIVSWR